MNLFNIVKEFIEDDASENIEYTSELDEFDYTVKGDFLFENEKIKTIFFYTHMLSVYHDKIKINLDLARDSLEEDEIYFFKLLFYLRDKNGLGLKKEFRIIVNKLNKEYPEIFAKYIYLIPKFGRYDDLYEFFYSDNENIVIEIFRSTLNKDLLSEAPSNLGKWLKSINTSSKEARKLGVRTATLLGYNLKEYRKIVSSLRKKLEITERLISLNKWNEIKYGNLSFANLRKYNNAFLRNDNKRFTEFLKYSKFHKYKKETLCNNKKAIEQPQNNYIKSLDWAINEGISKENFTSKLLEVYGTRGVDYSNWIPAISLSKKSILEKDNFYFQSIFLSNFFLCCNKGNYKDCIIKTNEVSRIKKLQNFSLKSNIIDIIKNSISEVISIENLFDLLLLSFIKADTRKQEITLPEGIVLVVKNISNIKELNNCTSNSYSEILESIYNKLNLKWQNSKYKIPKLKLWIIQENNIIETESIAQDQIIIVTGNNEKAFKSIIQTKLNKTNLEYDEIIQNLIQILDSNKYDLR